MAGNNKGKKKRKKKTKLSIFLKVQLALIIIVLLGVCVYYFSGIGTTVAKLKSEASQIVRSTNEETFRAVQTSLVYDNNGQVLSKLVGERDVFYISYDQIPLYVKKAFIVTEDKKFYSHNGIDFKAILRAFKALVENGSPTEGASTITQQLARTMFLSYEKTWERKVEEIFIALELEQVYSKEKILEYYINNIYFANGYYGIQAASRGYFSKDIGECNLSEIAFLCAIPNNPTTYDPISNYENTVKRRDRVLNALHESEIINEEQLNIALNTTVTLNMNRSAEHRNYVETYTYNCATRALMENAGFKFQYEFESTEAELKYDQEYAEMYSECQKKLYTGGYRIFTSIDLNKQEKLQAQMDNALADYKSTNEEGTYQLQGAAVCLNNLTGYVEAIVGGRSQESVGYTLNRAYQSYRQPGSAIKPLLVYTPQIERGYTADSIVSDTPIEDGPKNADKSYAGDISLRTAVAVSKNTVAWRLFEQLTPQAGLKYLYNLHFTHLSESDYALPSSIGGLTYGVSAVEMAGAYSALANDGKFREPTCIVKIMDSTGRLIWERKEEETQVYQINASRVMTDILTSVMKWGTAKGYELSNHPCAGKTGTTNDDKDSWFAGYTHYYTTVAWIGYDMPQVIPGTVLEAPLSIWKNFMEDIHSELEPVDFSPILYSN